ncbi:glucan 1,3-beta-glucosidase [Colletotrichum sp. SAR11_239]|nr:glucan 1,3-beta-glucosidase [Colletotrichum sp. SAR11_239]
MRLSQILTALVLDFSLANAARGFNYGATFSDGRAKTLNDYEAEFRAAASLTGTDGAFTSARLYTMIQSGTTNDPISAVQAAIATKTSLLLGLWASAGDAQFAHEIEALKKTIAQYGDQLHGLIDGISVGSEDLYRLSPMGVAAGSNPGAQPGSIVDYIAQVRAAIAGSPLQGAPIGHVDTWTAWGNSSNKAVVDACDWVGMDAYPFFDDFAPNSINDSQDRFVDGLGKTLEGAGDKPIWITETGWPVSGKTVGKAVASPENAKKYYDTIGCPMFANGTNVWWYTFQDSSPVTPDPSFGVVGSVLSNTPIFDLSCPGKASASSSYSTPVVTSTGAAEGGHASTGNSASPIVTPGAGSVANATYSRTTFAAQTTGANAGTIHNSSTAATPTSVVIPASGNKVPISLGILVGLVATAML